MCSALSPLVAVSWEKDLLNYSGMNETQLVYHFDRTDHKINLENEKRRISTYWMIEDIFNFSHISKSRRKMVFLM